MFNGIRVNKVRSIVMTLVALAPTYAFSRESGGLPSYRPDRRVAGAIRLWGHGSPTHDFMGKLVRSWEGGFAKYQPNITFEHRMYGTASSLGALYAGVGNLAIRGEEIHSFEVSAFERVFHYPPLEIDIATGSLDVRNMDFAHVFFVHKDNPISKLTLPQLDAIFGYEHRRGLGDIRTWGELGLRGEWADKPINLYAWKLDDDFMSYLQGAVLAGSHEWKCNIKEFAHIYRPDGSIYDSGKQILDALANDRFGIAVSNLRYGNATVKPLALAVQDGGPYYEATKENLIQQRYPLTRIIPAYVNRAPGRPLDPPVREFLRYILSREGQEDITREGGYLPLSDEVVREQLKKLQ
jgi:phosphate transport system substrate-binding protein